MAKILLVEDDLPLLRMYKVVLTKSGYSVIDAVDGVEALEKAEKEQPDLILLDVLIPKKSGFDVLKELKDNQKLSKIPVFCLTVLNQEEDIKKCLALGAEGYLIKTEIFPEKVVAKIQERLKH